MSVFAHIVLDGRGLAPEPAATKAFAYILNSDHVAAQAFVAQVLDGVGVEHFELGHIEGQIDHEGNRPDLVIHDAESCRRLIVEFKFWAGLTVNQPVGYLRLLPNDQPSALLFVVPERRIEAVWSELKRRCEGDRLGLEEGLGGPAMTWAQVGPPDGSRVLAITSWEHVLEGLVQGVGCPDTKPDTGCNIVQLKGLTEQVMRKLMASTALIVWWYGPYQGIEEFRENAGDGVQLYMAVSDGVPCHVGSTADSDALFSAEGPERDDDFVGFAEAGCNLYVADVTPAPAGAAGLAAAAERAADALKYVLFGGQTPDGYVSLFSSFYDGVFDSTINDHPLATPLPGFPILIAFNPVPEPVNEGNWTIVRVPRFR